MKLGADPELFVSVVPSELAKDPMFLGSRAPFPICGVIGHGKHDPLSLGDGYFVQEDNVALEYNIPPCSSRQSFIHAVVTGREMAIAKVQEIVSKKKSHLVTGINISAHKFNPEQLSHPLARIIGCDVDYNAWTEEQNKKPTLTGSNKNLRCVGGHIHVETDKDPFKVGRAMDLFLGVPFTLHEGSNGLARRRLYGKAGAVRVKSYGVEYRTLSNRWIFSESTIGWVWDQTERALGECENLPYEDIRNYVIAGINGNEREELEALQTAFALKSVPAARSLF